MKRMSNSVITDSYLAGLFDGEGWFSISRSRGRYNRPYVYQCHAAMVLKNKEPLALLQAEFGGTVRLQKAYSPNHSEYYRWRVTGNGAYEVAFRLGRYMLIKRTQSRIVRIFQKAKRRNGNRPLTDDQYARFVDLNATMIELNRRGNIDS